MNIDLAMDEHEIYRAIDALSIFDPWFQEKYGYRFALDSETIAAMKSSDHVLYESLETETRYYKRWSRVLPWTEAQPVKYDKRRVTNPIWDANDLVHKWLSLLINDDDLTTFKHFCEVYAIGVHHLEQVQENTQTVDHLFKTEFCLTQTIYHNLLLIFPYTKQKFRERHLARQRFRLFEISKPFFSKVRNNPIVDNILEPLFNISAANHIPKFDFQVTKNSISTSNPVHRNLRFSELGFKDLPNLDACCGFGFAVARRVLQQAFHVELEDCGQSDQIDVVAVRMMPPYDGRIEFSAHEILETKKSEPPKPLRDW